MARKKKPKTVTVPTTTKIALPLASGGEQRVRLYAGTTLRLVDGKDQFAAYSVTTKTITEAAWAVYQAWHQGTLPNADDTAPPSPSTTDDDGN